MLVSCILLKWISKRSVWASLFGFSLTIFSLFHDEIFSLFHDEISGRSNPNRGGPDATWLQVSPLFSRIFSFGFWFWRMLSYFLCLISTPSFDWIVETLKNQPVATPCVFSCQVSHFFSRILNFLHTWLNLQMGKGRTTVGLVTACLIKEIQITKELK